MGSATRSARVANFSMFRSREVLVFSGKLSGDAQREAINPDFRKRCQLIFILPAAFESAVVELECFVTRGASCPVSTHFCKRPRPSKVVPPLCALQSTADITGSADARCSSPAVITAATDPFVIRTLFTCPRAIIQAKLFSHRRSHRHARVLRSWDFYDRFRRVGARAVFAAEACAGWWSSPFRPSCRRNEPARY
jgi:hypothetical protein